MLYQLKNAIASIKSNMESARRELAFSLDWCKNEESIQSINAQEIVDCLVILAKQWTISREVESNFIKNYLVEYLDNLNSKTTNKEVIFQLALEVGELYERVNDYKFAIHYYNYAIFLNREHKLSHDFSRIQFKIATVEAKIIVNQLVNEGILSAQLSLNKGNLQSFEGVINAIEKAADTLALANEIEKSKICYAAIMKELSSSSLNSADRKTIGTRIGLKQAGTIALSIDIDSYQHKLQTIRETAKISNNKQAEINNGLRSLTAEIISDVSKILGPAPAGVKYAVISLGSLAREEACPYSDLKLAIILDNISADKDIEANQRKYFDLFIDLVEIKLINLGEDHSLIKEIKSGFYLNGLGNIQIRKPELLGSVEDLVRNIHVNGLIDLLYDSGLIYREAPNIEEIRLFNDFKKILRNKLDSVVDEIKSIKLREILAQNLLQKYLRDYADFLNPDYIIDTKKHVQYFPNFILKILCLYHGVDNESNSLKRLDNLIEKGHFAQELKPLFKFWISKSLELRYLAHFRNSYKNDLVTPDVISEDNVAQIKVLYEGIVQIFSQAEIDLANFFSKENKLLLVNSRMVRGELLMLKYQATSKEELLERANWYMHKACEIDIEIAELHWKQKLKNLFIKVENDYAMKANEISVQTYDITTMTVYKLKPELEEMFINLPKEAEGAREVLRLNFGGRSFHLKKLPEFPGIEYMVSKLDHMLIGYNTPFNQLIRIKYHDSLGKFQDIPVLVSDTMHGQSLFREQISNPNILNEIEPSSYSKNFLKTILVNPEDDQPSNYVVQILRSPRGEISKILVNVDNDRSFLSEPVTKSLFSFYKTLTLNLKSILYCAEQMKDKASNDVRLLVDKIEQQDALNLLEKWSKLCVQKNIEHKALFADYTRKGKVKGNREALFHEHQNPKKVGEKLQVIISMPIHSDAIVNIYEKLIILKESLRLELSNNEVNYLELLRIVEPVVAFGYAQILSESKSPFERFASISEGQYEIIRIKTEQKIKAVEAPSPLTSIDEDNELEEGLVTTNQEISQLPALEVKKEIKHSMESALRSAVKTGKYTKSALGRELNRDNVLSYDLDDHAALKFKTFIDSLNHITEIRDLLIAGNNQALVNVNAITIQRIINGATSAAGRMYDQGLFFEITKQVDEELCIIPSKLEGIAIRDSNLLNSDSESKSSVNNIDPFLLYQTRKERDAKLIQRQRPVLDAILTMNADELKEIRFLNLFNCVALNDNDITKLLAISRNLKWLDLTDCYGINMGNVLKQLDYNGIELKTLYTQDSDRYDAAMLDFAIKTSKEMSQNDKNMALIGFAEEGDIGNIKRATLVGADINYGSIITKGSALYHAVKNSHIESVRLLLKKNADPNLSFYMIGNSLSQVKTEAMADLLISYGARVKYGWVSSIENMDDRDKFKDLNLQKKLISAGMDINSGFFGATPFMQACTNKDYNAIIEFIDKGADVNIRMVGALTPLHALFDGSVHETDGLIKSVTAILDKGFYIDSTLAGMTVLHYAVFHGCAKVTKLLIDRGADVNAISSSWTLMARVMKTNPDEESSSSIMQFINSYVTPLHLACFKQRKNALSSILDNFLDAINQLGETFKTTDSIGTFRNDIPIILLNNGANVNARDKWQKTPLHYAAEKGDEGLILLLIERGADVQAQDQYRRKASSYAVEAGHQNIVRILEEKGITKDESGFSQLHHAVLLNSLTKVQKILDDQIVDVNKIDNKGKTAFAYAIKNGSIKIINSLIEAGAKLDIADHDGNTALLLMLKKCYTELDNKPVVLAEDNKIQPIKVKSTNYIDRQTASEYHNLGCKHHIQAELSKQQANNGEYTSNIVIAEDYFIKSIKLKKYSGNLVEYAKFLYQLARYEEAKLHLLKALKLKNDGSELFYDQNEKITLEPELHLEIDFFNTITVDAYLLAYYFLIKTNVKLGNIIEANQLIDEFKNSVELNSKSLSYSLLGYTYKALERFEEAAISFEEASNLYDSIEEQVEYTLSKDNQAICLSLVQATSVVSVIQNSQKSQEIEKIDYTCFQANEDIESISTVEEDDNYSIPEAEIKSEENKVSENYEEEYFKIVIRLINMGANVDVRDNQGNYPLKILTNSERKWNMDLVEKCLAKSKEKPAKKLSETILINAVKESSLSVVTLILAKRPEIANIKYSEKDSTKYADERPILYYSVQENKIEITKKLLESGAKNNIFDQSGNSPLHYAVKISFHLVSLLLEFHADPNAIDKDGNTPLHYAATESLSIVHLLLEFKANPNIKNKEGWTPIANSVAYDQKEITKLLLTRGAVIQPTHDNQYTMLQVVSSLGLEEFKQEMIRDPNQNVDIANKNGNTALIRAAAANNFEVVIRLIELRANVNKVNNFGETALHYAIQNNNFEITTILLGNGAKPDLLKNKIGKFNKNLFKKCDENLLKFLEEIGIKADDEVKVVVTKTQAEEDIGKKSPLIDASPVIRKQYIDHDGKDEIPDIDDINGEELFQINTRSLVTSVKQQSAIIETKWTTENIFHSVNKRYDAEKIKKLLDILIAEEIGKIVRIRFDNQEKLQIDLRIAIGDVVAGRVIVMPIHLQDNQWAGAIIRKQHDRQVQIIFQNPQGISIEQDPKSALFVSMLRTTLNSLNPLNPVLQITDLQMVQQSNEYDSGPFIVDNLHKLVSHNLDHMNGPAIIAAVGLQPYGNAQDIRSEHNRIEYSLNRNLLYLKKRVEIVEEIVDDHEERTGLLEQKQFEHEEVIEAIATRNEESKMPAQSSSLIKLQLQSEKLTTNKGLIHKSILQQSEASNLDEVITHSLDLLLDAMNEALSRNYGLIAVNVSPDGNCFFHAVEAQLRLINNGKIDLNYQDLRQFAINYIESNRQEFQGFMIDETVEEYVDRMSLNKEWADNNIIQALSRELKINIVIIGTNHIGDIPRVIGLAEFTRTIYLGHIVELHYVSLQRIDQWIVQSNSNKFSALEQVVGQELERLSKEAAEQMTQQMKVVGINDVEVLYVKEIIYTNPLLRYGHMQEILKEAHQIGGAVAVNKLIALGEDTEVANILIEAMEERGTKHVLDIILDHKAIAQDEYNPVISDQSNLPDFEDNQNFRPKDHTSELMLSSFAFKEAIEALPTIKYFVKEILQIKYELPELIDNNYFKISAHYIVCSIGMLSVTGKLDPMASSLPTVVYSSKILSYELLAKQKQINFQNTEDKSIDSPLEFIQKCGFDMTAQMLLGSLSSFFTGTPVFYDLAISASISGVQCYSLYNQAEKSSTEISVMQTIIPYAADTVTFYYMASRTHFDFTTHIDQMVAIKQGLVVMSSVVMTDHMTKLLLSNIQEMDIVESFNNIIGDVYGYFSGECNKT